MSRVARQMWGLPYCLANTIPYMCIATLIPPLSMRWGPFSLYLGPMGFLMGNGKVYHFFNSRHPVSMVKVQRKYISITQPLEIGGVGEVTQCSSRSKPLMYTLLNNTNLSLCLLLQTLTSPYWLLYVTRPGHFGDCWLCVPPGTSSQLLFPITSSKKTLPCCSPTAPSPGLHNALTFFLTLSLAWQTAARHLGHIS